MVSLGGGFIFFRLATFFYSAKLGSSQGERASDQAAEQHIYQSSSARRVECFSRVSGAMCLDVTALCCDLGKV